MIQHEARANYRSADLPVRDQGHTFFNPLFSSRIKVTFRAKQSGVRAAWFMLISVISILQENVKLQRESDRKWVKTISFNTGSTRNAKCEKCGRQ
jgi:hypothetical protein